MCLGVQNPTETTKEQEEIGGLREFPLHMNTVLMHTSMTL